MNRIAVVSANMGSFETVPTHEPQDLAADYFLFTDENFPPRTSAMTPRLQARIPKMFAWQMLGGYDHYVWIDSSCRFKRPDTLRWLLGQLQPPESDIHMAVFKHPNRHTIKEEADYLKQRLAKDCPYITPRYKNELIDETIEEIKDDPSFIDSQLFASTVLVYRNHRKVHDLMKEWWYGTSRYHVIDQLWLPYAIAKSRCNVRVIDEDYGHSEYIQYTRNRPGR